MVKPLTPEEIETLKRTGPASMIEQRLLATLEVKTTKSQKKPKEK